MIRSVSGDAYGKGEGMDHTSEKHKEFMEEICTATWKELYRFVYYKVQNREEAQDITQETYARAISYLEKHRDAVLNYGNYLKTIAMNIIRDQWRKKQKGRRADERELDTLEMAGGDFTDEVNERAVVAEAMKQLTAKQQEVITLRIIKGYSAADTAKIMGCREGTVRVMQYRALQALSELLMEKEQ